jgi:hypothetical protein
MVRMKNESVLMALVKLSSAQKMVPMALAQLVLMKRDSVQMAFVLQKSV